MGVLGLVLQELSVDLLFVAKLTLVHHVILYVGFLILNRHAGRVGDLVLCPAVGIHADLRVHLVGTRVVSHNVPGNVEMHAVTLVDQRHVNLNAAVHVSLNVVIHAVHHLTVATRVALLPVTLAVLKIVIPVAVHHVTLSALQSVVPVVPTSAQIHAVPTLAGPVAPPVVSNHVSTPVVSNHVSTPVVSNHVSTPVALLRVFQ